jgi:AraC-like DNA-binding protein
VNQLRIKEAMMLMNDPRYETRSIEEIGDIVGFIHRQTFHAVFLKHTGMTPKAYRMQQSLSTQEET